MFYMQRAQLHRAILLRDKLVRQNRQ